MTIKKHIWLFVVLVLILVPISFADSHTPKKKTQSQQELEKLVDKRKGENIKKDSKTGDVTVIKKPNKKDAGSVAITAEKDAHFKRERSGKFTVTGRKKVTVTIDENGKGADLKFRTDGPVETSLEEGKSYHPSPGEFLEVSIASDGTIKVTAMKIIEAVNKEITAELNGNLEDNRKPITKKIISKDIAEYSEGILTQYSKEKESHTIGVFDTITVAQNGASCKDCIRELPFAKALEIDTTKPIFLQLHRHSQFDNIRVFDVGDNEVTIDVTDNPLAHVFVEEPKGDGSIIIRKGSVDITMRKGDEKPGISGGVDFPDGLVLSYRYSTENEGKTKTQTYLYSAELSSTDEKKMLVAVDGDLKGKAHDISNGIKSGQFYRSIATYVKNVKFIKAASKGIDSAICSGDVCNLAKSSSLIVGKDGKIYEVLSGTNKVQLLASSSTKLKEPQVLTSGEIELLSLHNPGKYGKPQSDFFIISGNRGVVEIDKKDAKKFNLPTERRSLIPDTIRKDARTTEAMDLALLRANMYLKLNGIEGVISLNGPISGGRTEADQAYLFNARDHRGRKIYKACNPGKGAFACKHMGFKAMDISLKVPNRIIPDTKKYLCNKKRPICHLYYGNLDRAMNFAGWYRNHPSFDKKEKQHYVPCIKGKKCVSAR